VSAFFIPRMGGDSRNVENASCEMRRQIELELGRLPTTRRILRLWTRLGSADCITEVGWPDLLRGGHRDRELRDATASAIRRRVAARAR
jgi:hypothetical protein